MWIFVLLAVLGLLFGIAVVVIRRNTPESERRVDPTEQPPVEKPL